MAQLNDLCVSGSARFLKTIGGTVSKAISDENGNNIPNTYMKKGVDYVTAGQKSGTTLGSGATAEGYNNTSSGPYSHTEGESTTASNDTAHAEGRATTASGMYSHAEGDNTVASKTYSHAEGHSTTASGYYSHAEGQVTTASGSYSHSEGAGTVAYGFASYAAGYYTKAEENYQFVTGSYNASDSNSLFIIGNGSSDSARINCFKVSKKGMITTTTGVIPSARSATSNTVPNLINELRYLNGAMGSVYINTTYTLSSITVNVGWYNYLYIPHRTGGIDGAANGDNCNYGALWLFGMTITAIYFIRYSNGSVAYIKKIYS